MKPLPFDMTPLARSLSMPTVPRRTPTDVDSSTEASTAGPSIVVTAEPENAPVSPVNIAAVAAAPETATLAPAPVIPNAAPNVVESESKPAQVAAPKIEVEPEPITAEPSDDIQADASEEDPAGDSAGDSAEDSVEDSAAQPVAKSEEEIEVPVIETANVAEEATNLTASTVETVKPPVTTEVGSPRIELRTGSYPLHLKMHDGWTSQLAQEQIHALAIHILARHAENKLRTLAVTSALAGEGKTTISLALAEKLSQTGKRILIIDLDAHRATLSHEAKLDDAAGAMQSSDPRDPSNLDFHVYPTDIPGISIMPAGYPEAGLDGPPLISPVHIGVLVLRAIEEYDLIILDCPPLLPVADTHVIGEVADSALLVVRAGSTPRAIVDEAIDEFGRGKFLGAVLNRALPADIPYFREVYGYYRRYSTRE